MLFGFSLGKSLIGDDFLPFDQKTKKNVGVNRFVISRTLAELKLSGRIIVTKYLSIHFNLYSIINFQQYYPKLD